MKLRIGWKTITGALATAVGIVTSPLVLSLVSEEAAAVIVAAGQLLQALGLRHAVAKAEASAVTGVPSE